MNHEMTPNGTRLTSRGRVTRDRIVIAAAELMRTRGVAGTSIEDVRHDAAVSGSQMTHYFRDKRSLVRAVIALRAKHISDFHTQRRLGNLDTFRLLKTWADLSLRNLVDTDFRATCSFGALATEVIDTDDETRADFAAALQQWETVMKAGLSTMRDNGQLRPETDPGRLANVLVAAHHGGLSLAEIRRDVRPLQDALYGAIDYVHTFAAEGVDSPLPKRWRHTQDRRPR